MKKIFSKKWLIVFASAFIAGIGIILACADGWYDYYYSNFTPEAFVKSAYTPFFLSEGFFYYDDYETDQLTRFNEDNVEDWHHYLDRGLSQDQLYQLLYKTPDDTLQILTDYLNKKERTLPSDWSTLSHLTSRKNEKLKNFFDYLLLARSAERYSTDEIDNWWGDKKEEKETPDFSSLETAFKKHFDRAPDSFLKERYWFQLVRYYFYHSDRQKGIDLFEQHAQDFDRNTLYYRTLSYTAGIYKKLGDISKANYYYSLVYDGSDVLKKSAHFSFRPQEERDWEATLALAKTKEEKATLWQMLGIFYTDEERALAEIYQIDPSSDKLDLLLTRLINKEEEKSNALYSTDRAYSTDSILNKKLLDNVTSIAKAEKVSNPLLWKTAAGYLHLLWGDFKQADIYLQQAEAFVNPHQPIQSAQLRLLKTINKVAQISNIDSKVEAGLVSDLNWFQHLNRSYGDTLRSEQAFSYIKERLSKKYKQQKEWVKAELFDSRDYFYTDSSKVEDLIALFLKPNKTDFEKIALKIYPYDLGDLYTFKAIRATWDNRLEEAIQYFDKAPEGAQHLLLGNPFNGFIVECHDCEHESYEGSPYSRLLLVEKMKEMKDKVEGGEDVYNNALLLGNAFYNISFFGNARLFFESSIIYFGCCLGYSDGPFLESVTQMKQATSYYQLALKYATNDEQRAKCIFQLAKCERNNWYNQNYYYPDTPIKVTHYSPGRDWNYQDLSNYEKLREQYNNTQYYKEAIQECGYLTKGIPY